MSCMTSATRMETMARVDSPSQCEPEPGLFLASRQGCGERSVPTSAQIAKLLGHE